MDTYGQNNHKVLELLDMIIEKLFTVCLLSGKDSLEEYAKGRAAVERAGQFLLESTPLTPELLWEGMTQLLEQRLPDHRVIENFPAFRLVLQDMVAEGVAKLGAAVPSTRNGEAAASDTEEDNSGHLGILSKSAETEKPELNEELIEPSESRRAVQTAGLAGSGSVETAVESAKSEKAVQTAEAPGPRATEERVEAAKSGIAFETSEPVRSGAAEERAEPVKPGVAAEAGNAEKREAAEKTARPATSGKSVETGSSPKLAEQGGKQRCSGEASAKVVLAGGRTPILAANSERELRSITPLVFSEQKGSPVVRVEKGMIRRNQVGGGAQKRDLYPQDSSRQKDLPGQTAKTEGLCEGFLPVNSEERINQVPGKPETRGNAKTQENTPTSQPGKLQETGTMSGTAKTSVAGETRPATYTTQAIAAEEAKERTLNLENAGISEAPETSKGSKTPEVSRAQEVLKPPAVIESTVVAEKAAASVTQGTLNAQDVIRAQKSAQAPEVAKRLDGAGTPATAETSKIIKAQESAAARKETETPKETPTPKETGTPKESEPSKESRLHEAIMVTETCDIQPIAKVSGLPGAQGRFRSKVSDETPVTYHLTAKGAKDANASLPKAAQCLPAEAPAVQALAGLVPLSQNSRSARNRGLARSGALPSETTRLGSVLKHMFPGSSPQWGVVLANCTFLAQIADILIYIDDFEANQSTLSRLKAEGWNIVVCSREDVHYAHRMERLIREALRNMKKAR